ncbi:MAG: choice-of-anchor Q domain-containing protein [Pirellulales bacterium]
MSFIDSIIAGNTVAGDPDEFNVSSSSSIISHCLIGSTNNLSFANLELIESGTGNLSDVDPRLGPLSDNGGPTMTHALLPGSPATDAGDPAAVAGIGDVPVYDQRGVPFARVVDAAGSGPRMDIGAFELQDAPTGPVVVDTLVDEFDSDFSPGDVSLREAIGWADTLDSFDTITFDPSLDGGTIALELGEIVIREALTIDATNLPAGITVDAQQNSRIFNITAAAGDFTLAGMTLTGGRTTGANSDDGNDTSFSGGAIRALTAGQLILDRTTIADSHTAGDYATGGGVFALGDVQLTNSVVTGNSTLGEEAGGGGVYALGAITVEDSTVSLNTTSGDLADGGGMRALTLSLVDSTVSGNSTLGDGSRGGGAFSYDSATLSVSTISGNHTSGAYASGGGLFSGGDTYIGYSVIFENGTSGTNAGGGGVYSDVDATIVNSTIESNHTNGPSINYVGNFPPRVNTSGGGIAANGSVNVTESTFRDNSVASIQAGGGGIRAGTLVITNSTVTENTSPDFGGGIRAGAVTVVESVVSDNTGSGINGHTVTVTGSLVTGNHGDQLGGGVNGTFVTVIDSTISENMADARGWDLRQRIGTYPHHGQRQHT